MSVWAADDPPSASPDPAANRPDGRGFVPCVRSLLGALVGARAAHELSMAHGPWFILDLNAG
jgi:hypothetical protein